MKRKRDPLPLSERVPLGQPLPVVDEVIIDESVLDEAEAWWDRNAPAEARDLLRAKREGDSSA